MLDMGLAAKTSGKPSSDARKGVQTLRLRPVLLFEGAEAFDGVWGGLPPCDVRKSYYSIRGAMIQELEKNIVFSRGAIKPL